MTLGLKNNLKHRGKFPGGASYPAVLDDGNTMAWYDYLIGTTIATGVSVWADQSGNGNDLLQADTGKQPVLNANGILFPGVDEFLKATFTLVQPTQIYIVFKQITWTANDAIIASTGPNIFFYQTGTTPDLKVFAGSLSGAASDATLDTYVIARVLMDGASSEIIIDENTPVTGTTFTGDLGGITLAARSAGGNNGHIEVKELIVRKIADNPTDEAEIYAYLADKYSI